MRKKTRLICEDFEKYLIERNEDDNNYRYRFKFENGYVVSVIKIEGSYGYHADLFELAVILNEELCCDTPITNDVIGWLRNDEVLETLDKIRNLKKEKSAQEMFKELGYEKIRYYDRFGMDYYDKDISRQIMFDFEEKTVSKDNIESIHSEINMPELKAIIKKCQELGWLDA